MIAPLVAWLGARRWLVWAAVVVAAVALYLGWRSVQRGIGARKVIDEQRERHVDAIEAGGRARRDAGSGSERDRRLRERFRRH